LVAQARGGWLALLLLALAFAFPGAARAAQASSVNCNDAPYFGVIDGNVFPVEPSNLTADGNCTIRNYPASNPFDANMSFHAPGGGAYLVVFDNVVFSGSMSCNSNDIHRHKIWFVNGAFATKIHESCRSVFIPVEKIDKQNPAGQATAAIGVPFTYKMTIPILYDPFGGIVIDSQGSPNDLHSVIVTDDLNATGVNLSYVSHNVYWKDTGVPVPHVFTNEGGLLTFDFSGLPIVPASEQLVIELTVVLNDSPVNAIGASFINTARWQFGRYIEGVFYTPLPGENGVTPPLTIGAPNVTVAKSGPATLNLGTSGLFTVDAFNSGSGDAWTIALLDRLPERAAHPGHALHRGLHRFAYLRDGNQPAGRRRPTGAGTAPGRHLPRAPGRRHAEWRHPHQRGWYHRLVQRTDHGRRPHAVRAHRDQRHRGRHRPPGFAHPDRGLPGQLLREDRPEPDEWREPGDGRRAGRPAALHADGAHHHLAADQLLHPR
jgi:hypothetical protein